MDRGIAAFALLALGAFSSGALGGNAAAAVEFTGGELRWLADNPVVTMGYNPEWAPYEYLDENGRLSGVTAALAERFSEISGSRFVQAGSIEAWEDNLEGIRDGEVDLVLTAWAERSPSREPFMDFTSTWHLVPTDIVVREEDGGAINADNWHQHRVVIVTGYAVDVWLAENVPNLEYVSADSPLRALAMIVNGEADVYLEPWHAANYLAISHGIGGLANAGPVGDNYELVIGYPEGADVFGSILQKMIDALEGEKRQIISDAISRSYAALAPPACR